MLAQKYGAHSLNSVQDILGWRLTCATWLLATMAKKANLAVVQGVFAGSVPGEVAITSFLLAPVFLEFCLYCFLDSVEIFFFFHFSLKTTLLN